MSLKISAVFQQLSVMNTVYAAAECVLEAKEAARVHCSWQKHFPGQLWNDFDYL